MYYLRYRCISGTIQIIDLQRCIYKDQLLTSGMVKGSEMYWVNWPIHNVRICLVNGKGNFKEKQRTTQVLNFRNTSTLKNEGIRLLTRHKYT